ncbi:hypothetical protein B0H13DRAFT_1160429 [Mycena leptocephala]|nr:hypothetical protein B0H13DRAFT_1160429 [Mycena leptocephala]
MPRPPPLQLQFDNMFPGLIVRPRMQMQSLITGAYQSNWRMLVLCLTTVNALRFYLSATGAIADLNVDIAQNNPQLASVSRTLVIIYTLTCGIELFGAFSAFIQRRALIRIYAYLAFLSAALVIGAGVVTTAAYFTFADELIKECVALATAGQLGTKSIFRGDPWPTIPLSSEDAQIKCLTVWSSESVSQVIYSAVLYLLPSAFYWFVAYVYYRQTTDPTHPANLASRGSAIRLEARGSGHGAAYNPLQEVFSDEMPPRNGLDARRPGPAKRRLTVSPRSYQAAVGVAPLAVTSGSSLSPGPPSFSVAGLAGAGAYNRLSAGSEDDRFI